ncbi:MAG: cell division protein ZipA [Pseudomonadota bacterium]
MELLYIVGILLALALLVRGGLWLREYQRRLRLRLEPVPPGPELPESFPELGKVRVRPRLDQAEGSEEDEPALGPVIVVSPRDRSDEEAARVAPVPVGALRANRDAGTPAAAGVDEPAAAAPRAPVTEATVETPPALAVRQAAEQTAPGAAAGPAPAESGSGGGAPLSGLASPTAAAAPAATAEAMPLLLTPVTEPVPEAHQQDMFANDMIAPPPMPDRSRNRAEALYGATVVEPVRPVRAPEAKPPVEVQDVIALHVVARERPFNGEDLLRCILGYGLRFGDMSIFHRHERPTGQGEVLFSMASAMEPGTFDLQAMSGEELIGVSFFQSLPGVNSIHAYDIMVDTAKRLATELQGELLDQQQQPLTRQLVEHYRERVQEFERRRLMQRPAR